MRCVRPAIRHHIVSHCCKRFFQQYSFCTASEVLGAARSGTPAFADQFVLEQEQLGSFWRSVLTELPSYHCGRALPDWLEQTLGRFEPDRKLLFRTGRIGRTCFSATDLERPLECQTNTI